MNPTTDQALRSWLPVAADSHFPIQNIPYGTFRRDGAGHVGVAIGAEVLDLTGLEASDARRRCREAGLTCRTVYRTAPSEEEQGEVLDQTPAAGETVLQLTQITLFVGR